MAREHQVRAIGPMRFVAHKGDRKGLGGQISWWALNSSIETVERLDRRSVRFEQCRDEGTCLQATVIALNGKKV